MASGEHWRLSGACRSCAAARAGTGAGLCFDAGAGRAGGRRTWQALFAKTEAACLGLQQPHHACALAGGVAVAAPGVHTPCMLGLLVRWRLILLLVRWPFSLRRKARCQATSSGTVFFRSTDRTWPLAAGRGRENAT